MPEKKKIKGQASIQKYEFMPCRKYISIFCSNYPFHFLKILNPKEEDEKDEGQAAKCRIIHRRGCQRRGGPRPHLPAAADRASLFPLEVSALQVPCRKAQSAGLHRLTPSCHSALSANVTSSEVPSTCTTEVTADCFFPSRHLSQRTAGSVLCLFPF